MADEPTGNLDPDLSLEIMNLFREINAGGTTVLVATHDRELIRWSADARSRSIRGASSRSDESARLRVPPGRGELWRGGLERVRGGRDRARAGRPGRVADGHVECRAACRGWDIGAEFSVYLRDDATSEQRGAIEALSIRAAPPPGASTCRRTRRCAIPARVRRAGRPGRASSRRTRFRRRLRCVSRSGAEREGAWMPWSNRWPHSRCLRCPLRSRLAGRGGAGLRPAAGRRFALALLMAVAAAVTVATVVRLGLRRGVTNSKSWSSSARRWPSSAGRLWPKACSRAALVRFGDCVAGWVAVFVAWMGPRISALLDGGHRAVPADSLCSAAPPSRRHAGRRLGGLVAARDWP